MHAVTHAYASTQATDLMHEKNSTHHFSLCLEHWNEENERKIRNIKLNN